MNDFVISAAIILAAGIVIGGSIFWQLGRWYERRQRRRPTVRRNPPICSNDMAILNYSTTISVEKTLGEITRILTIAKADAIMQENTDGVPTALSFRIRGPFGMMTFRLPANIPNVLRALCKDGKLPYRLRTKEQAARVAWRVIKDWLEAQLALIQAQLVTLEQVFLPYAQSATGETLYETISSGGFSGLALPAPLP